jgi:hypothetical protein
MTQHKKILEELKKELVLSLDYLQYSFEKIQKNKIQIETKNPEELETFEALVSRFARVTDIFMAKYMRTFAEKDDPAYRGSLVDTIHYAEKKGLIKTAQTWIEIRELRNKIAHEYAAKDLKQVFEQVLEQTSTVLSIRESLK